MATEKANPPRVRAKAGGDGLAATNGRAYHSTIDPVTQSPTLADLAQQAAEAKARGDYPAYYDYRRRYLLAQAKLYGGGQ